VSSGGGSDGGGGAINAQGLGEDNNVDWSTSMSSLCMDEFSTIIIKFVRTGNFFSFYLELYENKSKNSI
jgi:hypothetical protein